MPINCDANCDWGEEASVFFSYIEGGSVKKVNLCKHCAAEKGVSDPMGYSLIDMLHGMGEETAAPSNVKKARADELTCEDCGFTQTDFKKTGRFGCARCYQVFSEGLETLLEAMHKKTEHIGKVPSYVDESSILPILPMPVAELPEKPGFDLGMDDFSQLDVDDEISGPSVEMTISMLQDKLDLAISEENYEEAAQIRDEINKLEESEP